MPTTFRFEDAAPGVKLLTLDRPDRLNAVNWQMVSELRGVLPRPGERPGRARRRAHGAGRRSVRGLDIKDPNCSTRTTRSTPTTCRRCSGGCARTSPRCPEPIIAAVNGAASGAGLVFSVASDIRLAVPEARFNMANVRIGFSGCRPRLVVLAAARARARAGLGAQCSPAASWAPRRPSGAGSSTASCRPRKPLEAAIQMAADIARNSPFAVRMTKQVLAQNVDAPSLRAAVELEEPHADPVHAHARLRGGAGRVPGEAGARVHGELSDGRGEGRRRDRRLGQHRHRPAGQAAAQPTHRAALHGRHRPGRREGLRRARELGVETSAEGVDWLLEPAELPRARLRGDLGRRPPRQRARATRGRASRRST